MSKRPQSKDEALEALDFIVNVLKGQLGDTGELGGKVEKVEQRISGLQNEINGLVNYLSTSPREAPLVIKEQKREAVAAQASEVAESVVMHGPPVILRCKQWEDFQNLASQAQTLSFMYKEAEKTFQADALKGNQVVTYSGELPKLTALLKMWLSKQLDVSEKRILEGILAIG
jgi:hypothetical protein